MADSKKATGGKRFSVYAGLGDSPEISWSTVASTLSEDLTSMRETKMKERAAIEKATNEQMEALNKLQDVNSRSLGRVVLEGSSQSKEELRLRMDLVRKGLLKPADYKLFMQEQKSGYSNFSNIVKTYDQWYTKAMEKIKWSLDKLVSKEKISKDERNAIFSRITPIVDLEAAVKNAELVIEVVPEIMELKKSV